MMTRKPATATPIGPRPARTALAAADIALACLATTGLVVALLAANAAHAAEPTPPATPLVTSSASDAAQIEQTARAIQAEQAAEKKPRPNTDKNTPKNTRKTASKTPDPTTPADAPAPTPAPAAASQDDGDADQQTVSTYDYAPDHIYPVRTALGITTQIELNPNEKILDYSTGFSSGWDITRRDNVFYLKPKNVDVDTNLMIRTETHAYIFELKVAATDWRTLAQARNAGVQYRIRFTYPADAAFVNQAAKTDRAPELSTALLKNRSYDFDYDYATSNTDAPWLIPANVWDDSRFTYIKMPDLKQFPTGDFPTVYMRNDERDGDAIVNTTVEGDTIVVHGTYPYLVLRHGKQVVGLRRNSTFNAIHAAKANK
jgi:type IV secretion system protein VirB9